MNCDEIGRSIVGFLNDAIAARDPERDIPRAEQIRRELAAASPAGADEHKAAILAVVRTVVDNLRGRPEQWSSAIHLIAIYLDEIRPVDDEPTPLKFSSVVLRTLLNGNPAGRTMFFERIDEWNVLSALEPILPHASLEGHELAAFLHRADAMTTNNMARGRTMDSVKQWATGHPAVAQSIVEAWLKKDTWAQQLSLSSIQILVEGIVKAGKDYLGWRDSVLDQLLEQNDEQCWGLATILACFAWPEPEPPVEERHRVLVDHVRRLPSRLLAIGLNAVAHDAWNYPAASIATTLRLINLTHSRSEDAAQRQNRAVHVAEIAWRALHNATDKRTIITEMYNLLPVMLDVPPHAAPTLDLFIANLAKVDAGGAEAFAGEWLAKQVPILRRERLDLHDILPGFAHERGPEAIGAWLVRCLVDRDAELRVAAAFLIARKEGFVITSEAFTALSRLQAEALMHELVGIGVPGAVYVPLLITLARARADVRDTVQAILIEDAIEDYPGVCREAIERWKSEDDSDDASLTSLRTELVVHLEERNERYKPQLTVPELRMTSPVWNHWLALHNRIFQEANERESGRSWFSQLVMTVPIARGEGLTMFNHDAGVIPLQRFSGAMELSFRDVQDHIAVVLSRVEHRKHAAELLAQNERAS